MEHIRDPEALNRLREGVRIKDDFTSKALVRRLPKELPLLQRNPPIRFRKSVQITIFSI